MSKAANHDHEWAHGASLLPQDLSDAELAAAPVLVSVDSLLIEDLTDDEDELFAAALSSSGCLSTPACSVPRSAVDVAPTLSLMSPVWRATYSCSLPKPWLSFTGVEELADDIGG